ncbi:hypothetical protein BGLT_01918 [Caballeronia glathei]|jgi:hypothetical protein|uniref:Purine nucleoside phosphorylase n=1 Tax=Caballeronia glathei TaxID=60547 RepID=A0A069PMQ0_9BURK|nr:MULTISPECIES: DUF4148 domain-containing protein [Burkholderiaceae]KDR41983.1 hypothetical protein BG61_13795 [Caballeronia glathei]TCK38874.1 uncharacterized protein DUF4148 [Paraburkholderia sp. BL8N3]CDY79223.1 hypothetical protein BGLT_01918 [Caballeronia glathei]
MKRFPQALIFASVLSLPLVSHAQSDMAPVTRAQVRAQLVEAQRTGQYPQSKSHYPAAQPSAAAAYVANRAAAADPSYGSSLAGSSDSGNRAVYQHTTDSMPSYVGEPVYGHH